MKKNIFSLACFSLNLFSAHEKLSDIKPDTALMWGILQNLEGERIVAPSGAPQKIKVFPRTLPLEIIAKILQEANLDTLAELPAKERLIREFDIPTPILVWPGAIEEDPLRHQLWLKNSKSVLVYNRLETRQLHHLNRPQWAILPTVRILNVAENKSFNPIYPREYQPLVPRKNTKVSRHIDDTNQIIIDMRTYNRIHHLPNHNTHYDPLWESYQSGEHYSPDTTKYITIRRQRPPNFFDEMVDLFSDTLEIHDAQTDECIKTLTPENIMFERNFRWSVDNKLAVENHYGNDSKDVILDVYDIKGPLIDQPCYSIPLKCENYTYFSFSPAGSFLALFSLKRYFKPGDPLSINFFDARTGKPLFVLENQKFPIQDFDSIWSPDESMVCVRALDGAPDIYSIKDKENLIEYIKNAATQEQQVLLLMLLKFNFTPEDLDHIKNKFPEDTFKALENIIGLT